MKNKVKQAAGSKGGKVRDNKLSPLHKKKIAKAGGKAGGNGRPKKKT